MLLSLCWKSELGTTLHSFFFCTTALDFPLNVIFTVFVIFYYDILRP